MISFLKKSLQNLKTPCNACEEKQQTIKTLSDEYDSMVETAQKQIDELQMTIEGLKDSVRYHKKHIRNLKKDIQNLNDRIDAQETNL